MKTKNVSIFHIKFCVVVFNVVKYLFYSLEKAWILPLENPAPGTVDLLLVILVTFRRFYITVQVKNSSDSHFVTLPLG